MLTKRLQLLPWHLAGLTSSSMRLSGACGWLVLTLPGQGHGGASLPECSFPMAAAPFPGTQ